ncbi:hypothetical protein DQ04_08081000 [Trypanosoma grayi]|uniref:hypothetical protein n=1 Tax=Trypanosoma grayi TaxID=71804 RepID=UPI0004F4BCE5|nr:hypothetical protein DQ04_08081000 [Trypanosoma grayi]KEG08067.1 hypothetical protein DQ04_08081000 [Trypanosoma grayi]
MVLRMKEEMKQLMVGEIQRFIIQNGSPHAPKKNDNIRASGNGVKQELGESAAPATRKREREEEKEKQPRFEEANKAKQGVTLPDQATHPNPALSATSITPPPPPPPPTATATTTTAAASIPAAGATETKPKPSGKRDFFGRLIPEGTSGHKRPAAGGAKAPAAATAAAASKLTVQYIYHDGSTNAVRIPASFEDF